MPELASSLAAWEIAGASVALGVGSIAGLGYTCIVLLRALRMRNYQFVLEDWLWNTAFPVLAYAGIAVAAFLLRSQTVLALFIVGAAALLLLFVGIHNAWDTVTYVTITRFLREREEQKLHSKESG